MRTLTWIQDALVEEGIDGLVGQTKPVFKALWLRF